MLKILQRRKERHGTGAREEREERLGREAADAAAARAASEQRLVSISGKAGWALEHLRFEFSDGHRKEYGRQDGKGAPKQFDLSPGERVVRVYGEQHSEHLATGIVIETSHDRTFRLVGSFFNDPQYAGGSFDFSVPPNCDLLGLDYDGREMAELEVRQRDLADMEDEAEEEEEPSFQNGSRVQVRNKQSEAWRAGTVTTVRPRMMVWVDGAAGEVPVANFQMVRRFRQEAQPASGGDATADAPKGRMGRLAGRLFRRRGGDKPPAEKPRGDEGESSEGEVQEEDEEQPERVTDPTAHPVIKLGKFIWRKARGCAGRGRRKWGEPAEALLESGLQEIEEEGFQIGCKPHDRQGTSSWALSRQTSGPSSAAEVEDEDSDPEPEMHPFGYEFEEPYHMDREEVLLEMQRLRQTIRQVHPAFQYPEELVPDAELLEQVRKSMPKTLRLNAVSSFGERPKVPDFPGDGLKAEVPRLIVVTGHPGSGGNVGLNGVYERHPDAHCGRPIYQKFLEKHVSQHSVSGKRLKLRKLPMATIGRASGITEDQTRERIERLGPPTSEMQVIARPRGVWFLYFADAMGSWCIGPHVGSREVYARCPGSGDTVPDGLVGWETWDVGNKVWRPQKRMRSAKGGH